MKHKLKEMAVIYRQGKKQRVALARAYFGFAKFVV